MTVKEKERVRSSSWLLRTVSPRKVPFPVLVALVCHIPVIDRIIWVSTCINPRFDITNDINNIKAYINLYQNGSKLCSW